VAKHKSGVTVIYRFHLTVPPLATTLRKMVTQSVRMGNAHAITPRWTREASMGGWGEDASYKHMHALLVFECPYLKIYKSLYESGNCLQVYKKQPGPQQILTQILPLAGMVLGGGDVTTSLQNRANGSDSKSIWMPGCVWYIKLNLAKLRVWAHKD
jgi:hypothetical protein